MFYFFIASYEGVQPVINRENPGFDTLDEMADKHNFFQVCF